MHEGKWIIFCKSHPFNWHLEDNNKQRNEAKKSSKFNHRDYKVLHDTSLKGASIVETSGFPLGLENLENLEKWEGIFQSGNFEQTGKVREKSGKITQNTGKLWEFEINII